MIKECKKHGYATGGISKIYRRWYQMNDRCNNPKNLDYKYYGGRGIKVCKRWKNSIQNFIDDMGLPLDGLSLDRINNNKGYSRSNCRWATKTEQMNNRINNVKYKGETLKEAAIKLGCSPSAMTLRIKRGGWSLKKTFETKGK